jgi:hypothetical protein
MQIDSLVNALEQSHLYENRVFISTIINKLGRISNWDTAKKFIKGKVSQLIEYIKSSDIDEKALLRVINKHFNTTFTNMNSMMTKRIVERVDSVDEGIKDWWKEATGNLYGALSFYPLLTVFLELDKIIKGSADANIRAMLIYLIIWVLIITGKVLSSGLSKEKNDVKASLHPSQASR